MNQVLPPRACAAFSIVAAEGTVLMRLVDRNGKYRTFLYDAYSNRARKVHIFAGGLSAVLSMHVIRHWSAIPIMLGSLIFMTAYRGGIRRAIPGSRHDETISLTYAINDDQYTRINHDLTRPRRFAVYSVPFFNCATMAVKMANRHGLHFPKRRLAMPESVAYDITGMKGRPGTVVEYAGSFNNGKPLGLKVSSPA